MRDYTCENDENLNLNKESVGVAYVQWAEQTEGVLPPMGVTDSGQHSSGGRGGVGQDLYCAGRGSVQKVCGVNRARG